MIAMYNLKNPGFRKRKWAIGLAGAFLCIVGAILTLQFLYEITLRKEDIGLDYWSRSTKYIENQKPEVLFWGASIGVYAFRHNEMGKAYYNMSMFSERPNFHYPKFVDLLKLDHNIKAIVIPAEYLSLHRWGQEFNSLIPITDFQTIDRTLSVDEWYNTSPGYRKIQSSALHFFPVLQDSQRKRVLSHLTTNIQQVFSDKSIEKGFSDCMTLLLPEEGFRKEKPLNERSAKDVEELMNHYFKKTVSDMSFDHRTAHVWQLMIDEAHANNIKVIGIHNPYYKFKEKKHEFIDDKSEAFFKTAGYDFILDNQNIFDSHPEYFHDPVHLSTQGALVYSEIVKKQIEGIIPNLSQEPFECETLGKKFSKMPSWPYTKAFKL